MLITLGGTQGMQGVWWGSSPSSGGCNTSLFGGMVQHQFFFLFWSRGWSTVPTAVGYFSGKSCQCLLQSRLLGSMQQALSLCWENFRVFTAAAGAVEVHSGKSCQCPPQSTKHETTVAPTGELIPTAPALLLCP